MNDGQSTSEEREADKLSEIPTPKEPEKSKSKGLLVATELGFTLAVSTCVFGFIGYWVGQNLIKNQAASFFLLIGGIILGFAYGIYRMVQVSERMSAQAKELAQAQKKLDAGTSKEKSSEDAT